MFLLFCPTGFLKPPVFYEILFSMPFAIRPKGILKFGLCASAGFGEVQGGHI